MTEARAAGTERPDLTSGGYEQVAVELVTAIAHDRPTTMILNVANGSTVAGLPPEAVIEVPCTVDGRGVRPLPVAAPTGHQLGLMQQVKTVEQLIIEAAVQHRRDLALQALALHPVVNSTSVADQLLQAYGAGPTPARPGPNP